MHNSTTLIVKYAKQSSESFTSSNFIRLCRVCMHVYPHSNPQLEIHSSIFFQSSVVTFHLQFRFTFFGKAFLFGFFLLPHISPAMTIAIVVNESRKYDFSCKKKKNTIKPPFSSVSNCFAHSSTISMETRMLR